MKKQFPSTRAAGTLALVALAAGVTIHAQTIPSAPAKVNVYAGAAVPGNASVSVTPVAASVQPGATVTFAAAISGTLNNVVVWTATGGSIAADGTFTAGSTAGTYTVVATLANGTVYGSAKVTVAAGNYTDIYPGEDIQARLNSSAAGTTFRLRAGVHRLTAGLTPKDRTVFTAEGGAILSGAKLLTSFTRSGAAWVASGQTQQGPVYTTSEIGFKVCRTDYPRCVYPEDLYLNDKPLQHVASLAAGGPGKWFFDYAADRIYFWDDPTGQKVETSVASYAIGGSASGVVIRGLTIEKFAAYAQIAAVRLGTNWVLEDSEVRWNHFSGVDTYSNSTSRRNFVHDNGCFGFHGSGNAILVENNEISYNGYAGFDPYWGSGGSKWAYTSNLTVRNNWSHHNLGPGLWTDINNIYTLYEYNTLDDNERGGIFHEISYDAIIRYNKANRNGWAKVYPYWTTHAGIEVVSSRNVEVHGNVLVDNWQGITGLDDHRGTGDAGRWELINLNVHDNTVTSRLTTAGTGRSGVHDTSGTAAYSAAGNNKFRNNTYIYGSPTTKFFFYQGAEKSDAEWRAYGQDPGSVITR